LAMPKCLPENAKITLQLDAKQAQVIIPYTKKSALNLEISASLKGGKLKKKILGCSKSLGEGVKTVFGNLSTDWVDQLVLSSTPIAHVIESSQD